MTAAATADIVILGAGIAGASLAAELAPQRRVLLVEREAQPGYHATGRSAAMFFESYGNATVRALTRASRGFFADPPPGFADTPLLRRRDALFVAAADQLQALAALCADAGLERIDPAVAIATVPILRPERLAGAAVDRSGHDLDVAALHQGWLRLARRHGATRVDDAGDVRLERRGGVWAVTAAAGRYEAPVVVNACGAWADAVGAAAGARAIGLQPLRRTALLLPVPGELRAADWPLVADAAESYYFKPDAGQLLLSPADETPSPPCDAAPDEYDVALAVDRFERATTLAVRRVAHRWAGLRSFVADRSPVVGHDDRADGFFWLAGQGGFGIQTAPALARCAAALLLGRPLPDDVRAQGVTAAALAPTRPALAAASLSSRQ